MYMIRAYSLVGSSFVGYHSVLAANSHMISICFATGHLESKLGTKKFPHVSFRVMGSVPLKSLRGLYMRVTSESGATVRETFTSGTICHASNCSLQSR